MPNTFAAHGIEQLAQDQRLFARRAFHSQLAIDLSPQEPPTETNGTPEQMLSPKTAPRLQPV